MALRNIYVMRSGLTLGFRLRATKPPKGGVEDAHAIDIG